jgi:hypothetical protein
VSPKFSGAAVSATLARHRRVYENAYITIGGRTLGQCKFFELDTADKFMQSVVETMATRDPTGQKTIAEVIDPDELERLRRAAEKS